MGPEKAGESKKEIVDHYLAKLRWLRDGWKDGIPDTTVHSDELGDDKRRVTSGWRMPVGYYFRSIQERAAEGLFSPSSELTAHMDAACEIIFQETSKRFPTQEDLDLISGVLDEVIEWLEQQ